MRTVRYSTQIASSSSTAPTTTVPDRASARRRAYLASALRLFAERGFVGTTTDMIVAEVGGSKATLYKHFPSKESLVAGIMEEVAAGITTDVPELSALETPLAEALTAVGRAAIRGVTSPPAVAVLRLCLGEHGRFPELSRVVWEQGPAVTYARFRDFLEQRQALGEVEVDDTQLAAEQFIAGLVGHIQLKVAMGIAETPSDEEIDRRVASNVSTFLSRYARGGR
jgi:AcrR family transcriptional regulator